MFNGSLSILLTSVIMSVLQKFTSDEIAKDVCGIAPDLILTVKYALNVSVDSSELTPFQVKEQPNVEWAGEAGTFYTLLMTDPDVPNRADRSVGEVRHWLVVNIPGNNLAAGEARVQYVGSAPQKDSGLHRYVFLLFKQTKGMQEFNNVAASSSTSREGRLSTNTRQLVADHNLELVAGNFFLAKYDDYVAELHAKMGGTPKN